VKSCLCRLHGWSYFTNYCNCHTIFHCRPSYLCINQNPVRNGSAAHSSRGKKSLRVLLYRPTIDLPIGRYQLTLTFGLLLAAIVNNATHNRNDSGSYRIPVVIQALWALILGVGILFLPETPRYFIKIGDTAKAARSLGRLRRLPSDSLTVKAELGEIIANHEYELSLGKTGWKNIIQKAGSQRKRLFTGCAIMALSQLTGINFIFYYGTQFFKNSGIHDPFLIGLTTNLVNVFSTIPGMILVEKWGRRPILLFGAIGMTFCEFIVAIVGVTASSEVANKVLIAFVCFYIFFFACSWGPVGWVVVGEIFPLRYRAKSIACSIASNWIFNWAIGYATPYLVDKTPGAAGLGAKVFFVWGTCCVMCTLFVYFFVYETKGLTLEQVDELYDHVSSARKSAAFTPQISYEEEVRKGSVAEAAHVENYRASASEKARRASAVSVTRV
jgi:SP family sugar:H+ symporter-like MFS transporter